MSNLIIQDKALHGRIRAAITADRPLTGPKAAAIWNGVRGATGRGATVDEIVATVAFVATDGASAHPVAQPHNRGQPESQAPDPDGRNIVALARAVGLAGFVP